MSALAHYGVFTPNGTFVRAATARDLTLQHARPIVYVRRSRKVCSDCATADGGSFDRKPASHKESAACVACGKSLWVKP